MAASTAPAFLGGDLPEKEQLAVEEGHDADAVPTLPSAAHALNRTKTPEARPPTSKSDKSDDGSDTSIRDAVQTRDAEKATPLTNAVTENDETETDPNIVDWDGPDDPANPMNWYVCIRCAQYHLANKPRTSRKKWLQIAMVSLLTFISPLASTLFAPAVPKVVEEFNTHSQALTTFVVSVYLLGFCTVSFHPLHLQH